MKKITQTITEKGRGDCWRTAVACLLELELEAVPHFLLHGDYCFTVFVKFLEALNYDFKSVGIKRRGKFLKENFPTKKNLIKRAIIAIVPSRTYKDVNHCVLINSKGKVIHDPSPDRAYLGENIFESENILSWYNISRSK